MNLISLKLFSKETFIIWCFLVIIIVVSLATNNTNAGVTSEFPTAAEVLSKAVEATSTVDYVGKQMVIVWHSSKTIAFEERLIHQVPSTHITELLTPIDRIASERAGDKGRSRRGEMSNRGGRDRRRGMLPPPPEMRKLQNIWKTDTQLLLRNYTVDVTFGEPIAGGKTYLLTINPKVASRPRKKVWLDVQHYIILRMEHYNIDGKLNSLSVCTTINYDSTAVALQLEEYQKRLSEKGRRPSSNGRRPYQSEEINFAEAEKQLGAKLPQPSYLPAGFQLQSTSAMTFRGKRIHFRYTDGLTALSLFVSKVSDEREDKRHRNMRGDRTKDRRARGGRFRGAKPTTITVKNTPISIIEQGHTRILQWEMGKQSKGRNLRFALIGELSQEELVKVAESLVSQR